MGMTGLILPFSILNAFFAIFRINILTYSHMELLVVFFNLLILHIVDDRTKLEVFLMTLLLFNSTLDSVTCLITKILNKTVSKYVNNVRLIQTTRCKIVHFLDTVYNLR